MLVADNEIAFNNYAGYDPQWEAGGAKWVRSTRLVVRGNRVHDNRGPGLWTDGSCSDVLVERNTVERNRGAGILHEIGYAAQITGNIVKHNGFGTSGWLDGAGIVVSSSRNVAITRNTIVGNRNGIGIIMADRGPPPAGMPPHEAQDVSVHDNQIEMRVGETGLVQNVGDTSYFTGRQNRFARNRYVLGCNASYFSWLDPTGERAYAHLNAAQWVAAGNDTDGHFTRRCAHRTPRG
jgi:nitrous oxidase accessory protein NosD